MNQSLISAPDPRDLHDDIPVGLLVDEPADCACQGNEQATVGVVELLLDDPDRVDRLQCSPAGQGELFPRFLLIALASYLAYATIMLLILQVSPPYPHAYGLRLPPADWHNGTAPSLPLAYTIGIVLTACVCLPTFYFHG